MKCIVQECSVLSGEGKRMYAPSKSMRLKWLVAVNRLDLVDKVDVVLCVCEDHFPQNCFSSPSSTSGDVRRQPHRRILPNAVPYIVVPTTDTHALEQPDKNLQRCAEVDALRAHIYKGQMYLPQYPLPVETVLESSESSIPSTTEQNAMDVQSKSSMGVSSGSTKAKVAGVQPRSSISRTDQDEVAGRLKTNAPNIFNTRPDLKRSLQKETVCAQLIDGEIISPNTAAVNMDDGQRNPKILRDDHVYFLHKANNKSANHHVNDAATSKHRTSSAGAAKIRNSQRILATGTQTATSQRSVTVQIPEKRSIGTQIITKYVGNNTEKSDGHLQEADISDEDDDSTEWGDDPRPKNTKYNSDHSVNIDDFENSSEDDDDDDDDDMGPEQIVIPQYVDPYCDETDIESCASERKFIVFERALDSLFMCLLCNRCGQNVHQLQKSVHGTCLTVNLLCRNGHTVNKWCSQPKLEARPAGNVVTVAAIQESRVGFDALKKFADYVGLCFVTKPGYLGMQKSFIYPLLKDTWEEERANFIRTDGVDGDAEEDASNVDQRFSPDQNSFDIEDIAIKEELPDGGEEGSNDIKEESSHVNAAHHYDDDDDAVSCEFTAEEPTSSGGGRRKVRFCGRSNFLNTSAAIESFVPEDILDVVKEELLNLDEDQQ